MQKKVEKIIREVAEQNNIPYEVAYAMFETQFRCAKEAIKTATPGKPETFKNVRFINLGILAASPGKILNAHANKQKLAAE